MRRPVVVTVVLVCVIVIASAVVILQGDARSGTTAATGAFTSGEDATEAEGTSVEGEERAGSSEVEEEQQETAERLEALAQAQAEGSFGNPFVRTSSPTAGWTGAQLLNPATDDWEPAVATDPNAPYVYLLTTRYGEPKTCPSHCPTPYIVLTVSKDGGHTWGPQVPLCVCRGSGAQYDPTIEVVPNTGVVYSAFLNADRAGGFSTVFIKSKDHGATWTDPVH